MITTDLFEVDSFNGLTRLFHYDDETGDFTIETIYDAQKLVDENKRLYSAQHGSRWGEGKRVAQIPLPVLLELERRGISTDPNSKAFRDWLNDPENRYFRTAPGKV